MGVWILCTTPPNIIGCITQQGKTLAQQFANKSIYFCIWSSTSYFKRINGATETKSISNDQEGCRREITTREYDGKKYVIETRKCPGVPEEFIERLFNIKREELPEFLKRWDNVRST